MKQPTSRTVTEYRLTWKRGPDQDGHVTAKSFRGSLKSVQRRALLLGPEPWRAWGVEDPDTPACCLGRDCGCAGETHREKSEAVRAKIPPAHSLRLSKRTVTRSAWEDVPLP